MALSVRRLRNDVLRRWCAPLVVALATVLVAPVAAHAKGAPVKGSPAKDRVEIGGLVAQTGGAWAVLTSPPPSDRKRLLGSDAFTVTVDGSDVAARAQARVPADLGVALVVSAGVGGKDVKVEQDAAIETVLGLPKATRAALVVQGTTPKVAVPLSTDRRAVTDAIGKVERSPDSSTLSALSLAADAIKSAPRRAIILFGPPGFVSPSEMASSARKLAARNVALFSIAPSKPQEAIADAVLATGGHTAAYGSATSSDGAVEAGRAIGAQLATQYLVTFTPRAKLTSHSKISVALDGVQGSRAKVSPLLLPGGANALGKTGRKGHHHLKRKLAAGAAAVLLLIVIALLVVVLRRRRRARAEPAFRVPATHVAVTPPAENASGASASVVTGGRHRHPLGASPRAGQVDDALDRLDAFASRWQPRSQGIFYAREALAIHEPLGIQLSLDELSRATALDAVTTPIAPVVRTIEALRWGLVRRSQGTRWSDIAVEVAAVVRGDLDPAELMRGVTGRNGTSIDAARQLERLPGRPGLEDEVPLREPVR
ncbi:MAG: VWA domain-containing protein, partial [Acidimicrobiia bacterium]|nr:VWA domain-containing protein [Acidimicrobiia bacterium]